MAHLNGVGNVAAFAEGEAAATASGPVAARVGAVLPGGTGLQAAHVDLFVVGDAVAGAAAGVAGKCKRWGGNGCRFVQVVDGERDCLLAAVIGGVGGDNGEAVAGFGFKVRVGGDADRTGCRVDAEGGCVAAVCLEAVSHCAGVVGLSDVDHLACTTVLIDRRGGGTVGEGGLGGIDSERLTLHTRCAGVTCYIGLAHLNGVGNVAAFEWGEASAAAGSPIAARVGAVLPGGT